MDEPRAVSCDEARRLMHGGAILLDVRDDHEWESGRAPGALHVALAELPDRVDDLDPSRTVVCACRSGGRSRRAALFLGGRGFDCANLDGGMLAWAADGGQLECDRGEPSIV